jgi:UDP-N-acetylglucosamine 2-epimerase (non-hydrolysing)
MHRNAEGRKPRVLVIIGTRPEGIKLAPVVRALKRHDALETRVALTGQHGPLMDQVIDVFGLPVDHDLQIMRPGQDLYQVTAACLEGLKTVVRAEQPDLIVAEGDTATVFVAGLVGFYERVRVAHVEAGLRSGDKWKPWPEEIFRRLTGVVADIHFAPTGRARENLIVEGVPAESVHVTGNTVVDALLEVSEARSDGGSDPVESPALRSALDSGQRIVLVTAHRRESFGEPLRQAFGALRRIADRYDDVRILYPVHPNPNVKEAASEILGGHERIALCDPLGYRDLVWALKAADLVITDSGGIQEEAPTFQKPVLVMREVTERPEGIDAGIAALVGTDAEQIEAYATGVLDGHGWRLLAALRDEAEQAEVRPGIAGATRGTLDERMTRAKERAETDRNSTYPNPYGDGRAGERIADIILHELTGAVRQTGDWPGP